jgi:hypothetical protein
MTDSVFEPVPPPKPSQFRLTTLIAVVTLAAGAFAWTRTWQIGTLVGVGLFAAMLSAFALPFALARRVIRRWAREERPYQSTVVLSQCCIPAAITLAFLTSNVVAFWHTRSERELGFLISACGAIIIWLAAAYLLAIFVVRIVDRRYSSRQTEQWRATRAGAINGVLLTFATWWLLVLLNDSRITAEFVMFALPLSLCFAWLFAIPGLILANWSVELRISAVRRLRLRPTLPAKIDVSGLVPPSETATENQASSKS